MGLGSGIPGKNSSRIPVSKKHRIQESKKQCCGSGSECRSVCFWASWNRIRIHLSEVWIRILISSRKNSKNNLDSYGLVTSFLLFIF
jgi:hypothetical protein